MQAPLTVVTAADARFARCLHELLASVARTCAGSGVRVIVWDLGLGAERGRLTRRFPWATLRDFPFDELPPHVRLARATFAWKPVAVWRSIEESGGPVLWLDAATLLRASPERVLTSLRQGGVFSLRGQSALAERCHPGLLERLSVAPDLLDRAERIGGVIGLDPSRPAVRALAERWRDLALDEQAIAPPGPLPPGVRHQYDQSLLSVLLHEAAARGEIELGPDEVDISSARPLRWLSTRNRLPGWTPLWAGAFARAAWASWKAADRMVLRARAFWATRVRGLWRWLHDRFHVVVAEGSHDVHLEPPPLRYHADPFPLVRDGKTHLFVEDFDHLLDRARISLITLGRDGRATGPAQPVLERPYHLSYPHVFEHQGRLFMVPESKGRRTIDLYVCDRFPDGWRLCRRLFRDLDAADSTLLWHDGWIWMFTFVRQGNEEGRALAIYRTRDLLGGAWEPHPVNAERRYADRPHQSGRSAGAFVQDGPHWLRPAQDNPHHYGEGLTLQRILRLDATGFEEAPVEASHPLARAVCGRGWHHLAVLGPDRLVGDTRDRVSAWDLFR